MALYSLSIEYLEDLDTIEAMKSGCYKSWGGFIFSDKESQCELMDRLMQVIIREEFEQEDALALSKCLCQILYNHFEGSLFPQELDEE